MMIHLEQVIGPKIQIKKKRPPQKSGGPEKTNYS